MGLNIIRSGGAMPLPALKRYGIGEERSPTYDTPRTYDSPPYDTPRLRVDSNNACRAGLSIRPVSAMREVANDTGLILNPATQGIVAFTSI